MILITITLFVLLLGATCYLLVGSDRKVVLYNKLPKKTKLMYGISDILHISEKKGRFRLVVKYGINEQREIFVSE